MPILLPLTNFKPCIQPSSLLRSDLSLLPILLTALSIISSSNSFAQAIPGTGGAGGLGYSGTQGTGGSAGQSILSNTGAVGGTGSAGGGGGGGGAGLVRGGSGGSVIGGLTGGLGGYQGVRNGLAGTNSTISAIGAGGGGGGFTPFTISINYSFYSTIQGGNGGNGGSAGIAGSGGGGGGGGNGLIVNSGANLTNLGSISGGNGGNGGSNTVYSNGLPGRGGNGGNGGAGIYLYNANTLTNTGTISGGNGGTGGGSLSGSTFRGTAGFAASGVYVGGGSTSTIVNNGTITGGAGAYGIQNTGTVLLLNNSQAGLTYAGALPTNYNIIINSGSAFGTLSATSFSGMTSFGIDAGSTVGARKYEGVLNGLTSSDIRNSSSVVNAWTNFNSSYKWELVQGSSATTWDLVVAARASNILSGTTVNLSNVGRDANPVLEGGILKVDSAGTTSTAFTIKSAGGKIDVNGLRSIFSGAFSDDLGSGSKLTIVNTGAAGQGAVVLSSTNNYSGGTEVQAGAKLEIASATALGSGALALVGGSTVPAILSVTASTTISNPITVSGDPVFSIASGTTTMVTSPITDGVSSGDVVVSGGGTLSLTAENTYTGPTTVDAGSTLALVGVGSITPSSALNNNGTVDVTAKTGNVALGGSYTQTSTGNLLMNISPTNNQKILVAGAATLAGGLSLNASPGAYSAGKYTLLTASGVTGSFSGLATNLSSYTRLGYSLAYDANDVYLLFTPNVADTQQSLVNSAAALQNIYTLQNSVLANSFSYDCTEFGTNGVCISVGGRNTAVSAASGLNNTSGLLIAAYRPHPNYRIGAYADQNLSVNNAGSTVNLGNNTPLIGLFGVWNERLDGTGTEVKVSAAYGQKNTTVTRQVVGTSEPGSGSSQLNSQGAQVTAKYGFGVVENVIFAPYLGLRYTQNNMGGYTEVASSAVTAPLTYSALNTNATTALAGLGASYRFIPRATLFASAGVETDTNTANGTYSATGLTGLTPINFNANPVKTRPIATVGAYYDVEKNQRLGVTGIYRQEPFQAVSSTTVMATYTIGM